MNLVLLRLLSLAIREEASYDIESVFIGNSRNRALPPSEILNTSFFAARSGTITKEPSAAAAHRFRFILA
jgi:hypothetical protein